jgi:hypothetical protein
MKLMKGYNMQKFIRFNSVVAQAVFSYGLFRIGYSQYGTGGDEWTQAVLACREFAVNHCREVKTLESGGDGSWAVLMIIFMNHHIKCFIPSIPPVEFYPEKNRQLNLRSVRKQHTKTLFTFKREPGIKVNTELECPRRKWVLTQEKALIAIEKREPVQKAWLAYLNKGLHAKDKYAIAPQYVEPQVEELEEEQEDEDEEVELDSKLPGSDKDRVIDPMEDTIEYTEEELEFIKSQEPPPSNKKKRKRSVILKKPPPASSPAQPKRKQIKSQSVAKKPQKKAPRGKWALPAPKGERASDRLKGKEPSNDEAPEYENDLPLKKKESEEEKLESSSSNKGDDDDDDAVPEKEKTADNTPPTNPEGKSDTDEAEDPPIGVTSDHKDDDDDSTVVAVVVDADTNKTNGGEPPNSEQSE